MKEVVALLRSRAAGHGDLPREPGRGHARRGHRHRHRGRTDGEGLRGRERPTLRLRCWPSCPRIDRGAERARAGAGRRCGGRCRGPRAHRQRGDATTPTGCRAPAWRTSTTTSRTRASARPSGSTPPPPPPARWSPCCCPELGVAIDQELATVLLTGIVPGHAHLRPSERHAPHPARGGRAGGGRGAAVADQPHPLRRQAVRHAGAVGPDAGQHRPALRRRASSSLP